MFIERRKMMRKLLILMLVLGMAPLAGATISLVSTAATVGLSGTTTVQVSSDTADLPWAGYLGYTHAGASLTSMWVLPAAGGDAAVAPSPGGYAGYWWMSAADNASPFTIAAGVQFEGTLLGTATGVYNFYLYDSNWSTPISPSGTFTLTVIPEPMTMALLGLGGLLLRRRK
jgi:hypothetical protein